MRIAKLSYLDVRLKETKIFITAGYLFQKEDYILCVRGRGKEVLGLGDAEGEEAWGWQVLVLLAADFILFLLRRILPLNSIKQIRNYIGWFELASIDTTVGLFSSKSSTSDHKKEFQLAERAIAMEIIQTIKKSQWVRSRTTPTAAGRALPSHCYYLLGTLPPLLR